MTLATLGLIALSVGFMVALLALFAIAGIFQGASGERPDGTKRAPGVSIRVRSGGAQSAGDSSASRHGHLDDAIDARLRHAARAASRRMPGARS